MILMKTVARDKAHVGHACFIQEMYTVQSDPLQEESLMENQNRFHALTASVFSFLLKADKAIHVTSKIQLHGLRTHRCCKSHTSV